MRKHLTKIFAVAAMMVMSLTAFADTAIIHSKIGVDGGDLAAANSWTGLSGSTAVDFIVDMPDNTTKNFSQAGWVTYNETNYKAIKNSNGQRVRIQLPSGKEAQSVTLYVYTNYEVEAAMRFNGVDVEDVVPAESSNENPAVITKALENETSFDFTFYNSDSEKNAQVCFIAVITYRNQPTIDPTRLFTFGYKATVVDEGETHTISALTLHEDNCDDVTTGNLNEAYNAASDKKVYHGTSTQFVDARSYRSMKGETHISSQEVAETEGAYIGYNLTIAENHFLTITKISTDIFNIKNDLYYEFVIQNSSEVTLYKSAVQTISRPQSGNHRIELTNKSDAWRAALSGLQGEVQVKLIFWSSNSSEYIAPSEFYVTGLVHEKTSQTKTLNRIDVNGVEYDFENEGNTISTLLHAAPSVKFYYSIINNWSDGSQTAAPDEEETVIASASGDNYVATTNLASEPYSLTFTNVDLPKVFGITRAVANVTSTSSDASTTSYKLSEDAVVDPSVTGVSVAMNYGSQDALTNSVRTFTWYNGTEAITCYAETGEKSYSNRFNNGVEVVAVTELNENCFYGFDLTVALGYKLSISSIYADVMKNGEHAHYQIKVYNNGTLIKTVDEVVATNKASSDMRQNVNTTADEALQDLTGTVTLKMFFWDEAANKYIEIKDFNVTAAIDANPGEGINTLSFVDFTPAKEPEFTNGEVTATWKMTNSGGNVGPQSENRGIRMQGSYGYQMKLTVPENSYISSVVFVWNGKGNYYADDEDPKRIIDMHITNSVGTEVSTLVYTGSKVNETEWTCGDLRESELTFAQGEGGDIYVNSIRVTYNKLDGEVSKSYTRTHTHMNLNTLCFPYTVTAYAGGTFYTMLYKRMEGSVPVEVVLEEHEGNLIAGNPYFYMPEGSQLELTYSGHRENTASKVNGVQGIYDEQTVLAGNFVTYNGALRAVGSNVTLKEYRAYIDMTAVSENVVTPAPGRRVLRVRNADAPAVTTDVEQITNQKSQITNKVIRDGRLLILRDGKVYNAFGQTVK